MAVTQTNPPPAPKRSSPRGMHLAAYLHALEILAQTIGASGHATHIPRRIGKIALAIRCSLSNTLPGSPRLQGRTIHTKSPLGHEPAGSRDLAVDGSRLFSSLRNARYFQLRAAATQGYLLLLCPP